MRNNITAGPDIWHAAEAVRPAESHSFLLQSQHSFDLLDDHFWGRSCEKRDSQSAERN